MKHLRWLILCLTVNIAAADLPSAEQWFALGEYEKCERAIEELMGPANIAKLTAEKQARLLAMKEYMLGVNPVKIAEAVAQAKKIAAHPDWVTSDLFRHAASLIRRAGDWKERGIPEYQELSDVAAGLLGRVRDNGEPEIALRLVILQTENFNLNGEFLQPLKLIQETIRLYYPLHGRERKLPEGAVRLLILAGEQHIGSGVRSSDEREKTTDLSQAAKYFLRAVESLPPSDSRYGELCDRLHYCREVLRLLGYQLRLPKEIQPQRPVRLTMVDEMLKHRRFHDVVLMLANNTEPDMKIRFAAAASACGKFDEAWAVVGTPEFTSGEPALLFVSARNFLAGGRKTEAAALFQLFLKEAPDNPDAINAGRQCAQLLTEAGKFREAADTFLTLSSAVSSLSARELALSLAARCLYQAEEYEECLRLLDRLPATSERALFAGQAEMRRKNFSGAMKRLEPLLENRADANRPDLLKLLIRSGTEAAPEKAAEFAELLLREYPADSDGVEYVKYLLEFYGKKTPDQEKYRVLGEWMAKHRLQSPEAVTVVLRCADALPGSAGDALRRTLLRRESFLDAELLSLMELLPGRKLKMEFFSKYCRSFTNHPERCALYLKMARLEYEEQRYAEAFERCRQLLAQPEVWQLRETKLLLAQSLMRLNREEDARRSCQELLLIPQPATEKREVVLLLAPSWERSGEHGKAIATAWSAVPADGRAESPQAARQIADLLKLIIRNAEKIGSPEDRRDAEELLQLLPAGT